MSNESEKDIALVFDTSNEVVACGIGRVHEGSIELIAEKNIEAHRASNTKLLIVVNELFEEASLTAQNIALVGVGQGPGSFTGVRIAMATAKGIAQSLGVSLIGISTLASIAWNAWRSGIRGRLLVVGDAMRKEIYPAYFTLDAHGVTRLTQDRVVKAQAFAKEATGKGITLAGDALFKYGTLFCNSEEDVSVDQFAPQDVWTPSGFGLLLALQDALANVQAFTHPEEVLPIYTRLSDAEESERERLANPAAPNLVSGVQDHNASSFEIRPASIHHVQEIANLEREVMGSEAWSCELFQDDFNRAGRIWWMALSQGSVVGYVGVFVIDGRAEILKIATSSQFRLQGIARALLGRALDDARNLAASTCFLEVRSSNTQAQFFYEKVGFSNTGIRKRYYSDGEDALLFEGDIDAVLNNCLQGEARQVAGIVLDEQVISNEREILPPYILAIETSCDETAASVVGDAEQILSDVVASQINFHARFGGVVPEIASRKHIETICGVADAALTDAHINWSDLNAIAATYTPGLVGALVVGVAYAKGVAWALDIPFIGVNHLEGHLYANKLACTKEFPFTPPAVVSLISGGNTMLVFMKDWHDYEILGSTIDDAVGEAFDKVAKALSLPYPGGPHISRLAEEGDASAIDFPRALLHSKDYRFSLSGLKTAVITYINKAQEEDTLRVCDVCASFQQAVIDVQVAKAAIALDETGASVFCCGGGVAANKALRSAYEAMCSAKGVRFIVPPLSACGDHAAMIALVAYDRYLEGRFFGLEADAYAHADLSEPY